MYIKLNNPLFVYEISIIETCPHCGCHGTFEKIGMNDIRHGVLQLGLRKCPNLNCMGQLFFIYSRSSNKLITTYPARTISFDKANIPAKILSAFEEAIICHSNNCYISSAIMIRKTLEEVCKERNAIGTNLFKKLEDLSSKITIPNELKEGMQELRLLGNDAAHIESETFQEIGNEEIEISIEFTKEILKAVYQYESLLGKLRSLKKTA